MQPSQSHKSKAAGFTEKNLAWYLQGNKQQKCRIHYQLSDLTKKKIKILSDPGFSNSCLAYVPLVGINADLMVGIKNPSDFVMGQEACLGSYL